MKRKPLFTAAAVAAGLALTPAVTYAAIMELGATGTPVISPRPCTTGGGTTHCPGGVSPAKYQIVLTRVTALPTIKDGLNYPTTVKKAGRIVAFTVGLSRLDTNRNTAKSEIHFLDQTYHGTTQVAVAVLRRAGPANQRRFAVVAESPVYHLQPYLGQVVQLPLTTTLPVVPGEVVALTVPTWAPILTISLPNAKFAYRQSRSSNCNAPPAASQAQLSTGRVSAYKCNYAGTTVEFSATEVTNPAAPSPIHEVDLGG